MHIPKKFVTAVWVGPGPWGGPYADPCYCGRPFEDGDEVCIVKSPDGSLKACHEECVRTPD